ncbi:MAG: PTS sugar transporter subunit IIA [Candidatus Marinimicrobia bacterium]|nr:PTS sugar transporter subunit IIA [Candidatus Neomarinimicrobiota bacterium]
MSSKSLIIFLGSFTRQASNFRTPMNLQEILSEDNIVFVTSESWGNAITEITGFLKDLTEITDISTIVESVRENEEHLASSAGRGVAYPHGISSELQSFVSVIGINRDGFECSTPDGLPCQIIVLTVSPAHALDSHCKFLSLFRSMISNSAIRASILETQTISEVVKIIHNWQAKILDPEDDDI